ncbi:hypothetical protein RFN58_22660 [Streptomyces iakyrus]|nr:hypothetical protein [Streptomyces iakyrus]
METVHAAPAALPRSAATEAVATMAPPPAAITRPGAAVRRRAGHGE